MSIGMKNQRVSREVVRLRRVRASLALAAAVAGFTPFWLQHVQAANVTWDAGNTTNGATIDPASGTWNTTNTNWFNGTADVAWPANSTSVFAGADGTYAITLASNFTSTAVLLDFENSGNTISAASPFTLTTTFSSSTSAANNPSGATQAKSGLWIAAGKTATLGSGVTYSPNGTSFGVTVGGAASSKLIIASGAKIDKSAVNFDLI